MLQQQARNLHAEAGALRKARGHAASNDPPEIAFNSTLPTGGSVLMLRVMVGLRESFEPQVPQGPAGTIHHTV